MKYLILVLVFICIPSYAWQLSEIKTTEKETVGFILHTESTGLHENKKVPVGLRFVCSKTKSTPDIIAIYWNFTDGFDEGPYQVNSDVDFQRIPSTTWYRVGTLIYTEISENKSLTETFSQGKTASFYWSDHYSHHYSAVFDIEGFSSQFSKFNKACRK